MPGQVLTPDARPPVSLRAVIDDDLELFYREQLDEDATRMAAFSARGRADHMTHWNKILRDETVVVKTILYGDAVAGNVVEWLEESGERAIGYWIAKAFWGKGIATAALGEFLHVVGARPLIAHVAKSNVGSIRVLEKCGFEVAGERTDGDVEEWLMVLLGPGEA